MGAVRGARKRTSLAFSLKLAFVPGSGAPPIIPKKPLTGPRYFHDCDTPLPWKSVLMFGSHENVVGLVNAPIDPLSAAGQFRFAPPPVPLAKKHGTTIGRVIDPP